MYGDDTPRAEQRAALLSLDRALLDELMGGEGADDATLGDARRAPRTPARHRARTPGARRRRARGAARPRGRSHARRARGARRAVHGVAARRSARELLDGRPRRRGAHPCAERSTGPLHPHGRRRALRRGIRRARLSRRGARQPCRVVRCSTRAAPRGARCSRASSRSPARFRSTTCAHATPSSRNGSSAGSTEWERSGCSCAARSVATASTTRWCSRRLLEQARRRELAQARKQIEAVPIADVRAVHAAVAASRPPTIASPGTTARRR